MLICYCFTELACHLGRSSCSKHRRFRSWYWRYLKNLIQKVICGRFWLLLANWLGFNFWNIYFYFLKKFLVSLKTVSKVLQSQSNRSLSNHLACIFYYCKGDVYFKKVEEFSIFKDDLGPLRESKVAELFAESILRPFPILNLIIITTF